MQGPLTLAVRCGRARHTVRLKVDGTVVPLVHPGVDMDAQPVGVWGEAASRGLRAPEVPAWLEAGFQPVEVLRYAHLRVPLEQAVRWQDADCTAYVATGCLGIGMTLADACALRGLPTKQVQQRWRSAAR